MVHAPRRSRLHRTPRRARLGRLSLASAATCLVAGFAFVLGATAADSDPALPPPDTVASVLARGTGARVPTGFVGVSFEFPAVTQYAGTDPARLNPAIGRLLEDLVPGQSPVIRIGGDSGDATWWPVRGMPRPAGVTYTLSSRWLAVVHRLAAETNARLILGIDLEANQSALAQAEARAFAAGLPATRIRALELGNEPTRYTLFPWYHDRRGKPVLARPRGYDLSAYTADFSRTANLMPRSLPLAGPTLGGGPWMNRLGWWLDNQPRVGLVTFHRYPMNRCFTPLRSPDYPTIPHLLRPSSSRGLGQSIAGYVAVAGRHHRPFRVDEMNSVACGGKNGVSNTFASALWALDATFAMVRAGASGVNVHTFPTAAYGLWHVRRTGGTWSTSVAPEYYGLLTFAMAAPAGSFLLGSHSSRAAVRSWATRARDGTIRVTLINDDVGRRHVVLVRLPSAGSTATVTALRAPSVHATGHVSLGGASFNSAGVLTGVRQLPAVLRSPRRYLVVLPGAGAAVLTVHVQRGG